MLQSQEIIISQMAKIFSLENLALLIIFFLFILPANGNLPPKVFNVNEYGAVADGKADNTRAFLKAWNDACIYPGRSRFWIPRGIYLLGSVSFEGPCGGSMAFVIKGALKAPTDPNRLFTDTWIGFRYLNYLTVKGGGYLDGQGHAAWRYNDCQTNRYCKPLPTSLRLDFVRNSRIHQLHSINSKNSHFNIFACHDISISNVRIAAPANSPNTDGIRIGSSTGINISNSVIGTGDDCISLVSGSQSIDINNVVCGPGHGISVGSLGRTQNEYVTGISVRNCTFLGTENGVRIKTWAPSLQSLARGLSFEDIIMRNVRNPIVIDQHYCPSGGCKKRLSSGVQIKDVTFKNIRGVSTTKIAVSLQCSRALPCRNVKLIDINLLYNGPGRRATSLCSHVIGSSYGKKIPGGCM